MRQFDYSIASQSLDMCWPQIWRAAEEPLTESYPLELTTVRNLNSGEKLTIVRYLLEGSQQFASKRGQQSHYKSGMYETSEGLAVPLQCKWLEIRGVGRGITIMGSGEMRPYVPAIPIALSGKTYTELRRLWLLHPSESSSHGSWKIAEKLRLFTLERISDEWPGIERRKGQVIRSS